MSDTEKPEKENLLKWAEVRFIIFVSAIIFFLTAVIFMRATCDIRDYVSDHRMINYDCIEFALILIFIISFYVISKICHPYIKSILPKKLATYKCVYLIPGTIFSLLAIICISYIVLPKIVGDINSPEMQGLRGTVSIWLFSILLINILLDHGPFEEPLTKGIEKGWSGFKSIFKKFRRYIYG